MTKHAKQHAAANHHRLQKPLQPTTLHKPGLGGSSAANSPRQDHPHHAEATTRGAQQPKPAPRRPGHTTTPSQRASSAKQLRQAREAGRCSSRSTHGRHELAAHHHARSPYRPRGPGRLAPPHPADGLRPAGSGHEARIRRQPARRHDSTARRREGRRCRNLGPPPQRPAPPRSRRGQ